MVWEVVAAVEEEEDSTALEVECQGVWEVVGGEVLHKASLVDSLSNDRMPMRRVPFSTRETTRLMTTVDRRATGPRKRGLPETSYWITIFNGLADWVWDSYSQAFSFRLISWRHCWSWGLECTVALK